MMFSRFFQFTVAVVVILSPQTTTASPIITTPTLSAMSVHGEVPRIDGVLDEFIWQQAAVATDFIQLQPLEGDQATEKSEVRVLYGHDALYIGFLALDSNPEAIEGQLTRRDQGSFSDWIQVAVDSYHDQRTAFQFSVNPVGVKRDSYRYNDTRRDRDWDAVWDVATSVNERGWVAEFRIPYSQLRFTDATRQTWGIQFSRWIARKDEMVFWAPITGDIDAVVSRYGKLQGIDGIKPQRRLEVTPYAVSRLQQAPADDANPFYESSDDFYDAGVDIKYGLTSNLTLDVTVNPDFGQVEADPAQVNLSEFESFFPERRPFFLEGANIFDFRIGDGGTLFHSRRIGRKPQGYANPLGGHADVPDNTTIQTAAKLTGKTESDITIGLLFAATDTEMAEVISAEGAHSRQVVEPAAQYGLIRMTKDLRQGRSVIGLVATGVKRDSGSADALSIHDSAITGGIDFQHNFGDENYRVSGFMLGSQVAGSKAAIARTQRAPGHYMHRPDAHHLDYNPNLTSLNGTSAELTFSKVGGGFWRYGAGFRTRTPEFETNDVGFMNRADYRVGFGRLEYNHYLPSERFRQWRVTLSASQWESTGGERTGREFSLKGKLQLHNHWNASARISYKLASLSLTSLRGGPALQTDNRVNTSLGISTDGREKVSFNLNVSHGQSDNGSNSFGISPVVFWRPSGRLQISAGAYFNSNTNEAQWVTKTADEEYIFSRIQQKSFGLTLRMDYAFSRDLTLELYAQPYVSSGAYDEYKQVVDPLAKRFANRFESLTTEQNDHGHYADINGSSQFIHDPGFNFKQLRSNTVLRWEYNPGSTVYFVWSHGRQHYASNGEFDLSNDVGELYDAPADDVFMVKVNYWMNPMGLFKR